MTEWQVNTNVSERIGSAQCNKNFNYWFEVNHVVFDSIKSEFVGHCQGSIYWRQFPSNQTVKMNDSISMKCEGESSEPLQYRWWVMDDRSSIFHLSMSIRLKDDVFLSDTISSEDRIRTYSDGALIIHRVQPSDQGAYVCMISTHNGTNIRSKPAILTVRCRWTVAEFELIVERNLRFRSAIALTETSTEKSNIDSRITRCMSLFTRRLSVDRICLLVS